MRRDEMCVCVFVMRERGVCLYVHWENVSVGAVTGVTSSYFSSCQETTCVCVWYNLGEYLVQIVYFILNHICIWEQFLNTSERGKTTFQSRMSSFINYLIDRCCFTKALERVLLAVHVEGSTKLFVRVSAVITWNTNDPWDETMICRKYKLDICL